MSIIVKPNRDEDFYVVWSDIVDSPLAYGPRDYIVGYLIGGKINPNNPIQTRLARADAHGSSADWPDSESPTYGWHDDVFIYDQQGICPRANLRELCARLGKAETDGARADVADLLRPFDE